MQRIVVALLLALWLMHTQASAQVTVYTSEAAFLAALSPTPTYYKETFDSVPFPPSQPLNFALSPFAYNATVPGGDLYTYGPGDPDVWLSTATNVDQLVFTFTSGNISAVGGYFFTTGSDGAAAPGTINVTVNGFPTQSIPLSDETSFLGFTAYSSFDTLTITASQGVDSFWPTVNDFIVGVAAVPEPATWAMIGICSVGLIGGVVYRRRKHLLEAAKEVEQPVSA
ncbi:MAG: PEP-CTERM sorting domain-containing protein [Gemmatales bacterium]